jgi:RimJ/RimL family protein N-acetyltransferase
MAENPSSPDQSELTQVAGPIVIETDQPGLVLVEMLGIEDDEKVLNFQNRDADHIKEFGNTIFSSVEEVTSKRLEMGGQRFWIRKDGVDVGWEGYGVSEDGKTAEVGIIIAEDASGHGYATSAVKAITKHIEPDFEDVIAEARADHGASIAVLKKSGYEAYRENAPREWAGEAGAVVLKYAK